MRALIHLVQSIVQPRFARLVRPNGGWPDEPGRRHSGPVSHRDHHKVHTYAGEPPPGSAARQILLEGNFSPEIQRQSWNWAKNSSNNNKNNNKR